MRKLSSISFVLIAIFMVIITGCSNSTNTEEKGKFNAGTYKGASNGHGGEIKATVTVSKDKIEKIEISADGETGSISDGATTQLTDDTMKGGKNLHPTTDPETGYLFTEGLRGVGAILINKEGKRFTNELLTRDVVSKNILAQTDKVAYLVVNQEMADENASLAGYIEDGYAIKGETIESLGSESGIDSSALATTLKKYTKYVKNKGCFRINCGYEKNNV